jgi:uncharacterized protein (TIGR00661 family)
LHVKNNIKKVLIAPLDWGLGHATRCIPLIKALQNDGFEVLLAAEKSQAHLLQAEFPTLICLPLRGYRVAYSKQSFWLPLKLLQQIPRILSVIRREKRWLKQVVDRHQIDMVISDNRFGLSHHRIPSIFITHQLLIKAPFQWMERWMQHINYYFINQFTCCWVPDAAGQLCAAGRLSHPKHLPSIPVHYIGLLSRFEPEKTEEKYDYCVLLSGPEPQRTLLEKKLLSQLKHIKGRICFIRGLPGGNEQLSGLNLVSIKNHVMNEELANILSASRMIICRSGFTTIMEVLSLQKKAIIIPTPGQTEQVYLGESLMNNHFCYTVYQHELNLEIDLPLAEKFEYRETKISRFDPSAMMDLITRSIG